VPISLARKIAAAESPSSKTLRVHHYGTGSERSVWRPAVLRGRQFRSLRRPSGFGGQAKKVRISSNKRTSEQSERRAQGEQSI